MREVTYSVAARGLATSFAEAELPIQYAARFRNRFINVRGGAEKRQGISQRANTVPSGPNLTGLHELVKSNGTTLEFTSGNGTIYRRDGDDWVAVKSGLDPAPMESVQMGERLIFYNGVDRNFFTKDGETFEDLLPIIAQGKTDGSANTTTISDADYSNWATGTDVATNDLVWNVTKDAYGAITAVTSAAITHTTIGTGGDGIGAADEDQSANDFYRILDMVELNIIPTENDPDNIAVAASGASDIVVRVSAVDFSTTEIKTGDYIRNTTRGAVTRVTSVSADVNVVPVSGQIAGDSLVFLKSAMPITYGAHVHYGRLYMIDARDRQKVRISGANDPQDMTTDAGTLDSISFSFGDLQPQGDVLQWIDSFQRFFIMGGRRNIYAYAGTSPIGEDADFIPIGLFPQGSVSSNGSQSTGNDMTFVSPDGLQSFALIQDASNLQRANLSEQIKVTLREEIRNASDIQLIHYPRRSWLLLKVGSQMYVYSYTVFIGDADGLETGAWHLFDGLFARQNAYMVNSEGDLVCCGANGKVYTFDQDTFTDDGQPYTTEYQTGWLSLEEPKKTRRRKALNYIRPILDAGGAVEYTIRAEAPFDATSTDSLIVSTSGATNSIGQGVIGDASIGGSSVLNDKYPLRVRGEVVRVSFETNDDQGPDVINRYTLFGSVHGRE